MHADRTIARLVGVFYIAATLAGLIGIGLTQSMLDAPDYLTEIAAHDSQVAVGALFELVMAVAVVGISVMIYPVLRRYSASVAIAYVGARLVEAVIFLIAVLSLLSVLTLSRDFVDAGAPDAAYYATLGDVLLAVRDWSGHVALDVAVFPLGALILYTVLYRFHLVPRWLSGWGLVGAVLYWAASLLVMFDLVDPLTTIHVALQAPIGLQEMVFAVWLIVKGFDASALAAGPLIAPAFNEV